MAKRKARSKNKGRRTTSKAQKAKALRARRKLQRQGGVVTLL